MYFLSQAGLFSAVVSKFLITSLSALRPDYQAISAKLLFDQINIQRTLANGTSLDDITTSGTDPTAPFTPDSIDVFIIGFWFASLIFSLAAARFAIAIDAWYCHNVSPIAGQPKVHAHTRHLHYKGIIKLCFRTWSRLPQLLLYLSLISFMTGLILFASEESEALLLTLMSLMSLMSMSPHIVTVATFFGLKALQNLESFRKTPITYISSAICERPPITTVPGLCSSLEVKNLSEVDNVQASEIYAAHKSRIENEVNALHWLYERSSTSTIHRLVIQALAGLSPNHKAYAEEAFSPRRVEIRDEKERMLMDCMELARDGTTRWIPKDIP